MTKAAVDQVVRRAIGDAAFRAQLHSDPAAALAGFQLTKDERSAITSGDPTRLTALGVDQRMSKAFDLGGQGVVSKMISPEAAGLTSKALIDEGARTSKALIDEGSRTSKSVIDEGTAGSTGAAISAGDEAGDANAFNLRRIEGDLNTASAAQPVDASGDFNALDPGYVSRTASKLEPVDVSGDFNQLDPGFVSGDSAAQASDATNVDSAHTPGSTTDASGNTITE